MSHAVQRRGTSIRTSPQPASIAPSSPSAWCGMVQLHLVDRRDPVITEGEVKVPAAPIQLLLTALVI